MGAIATIGSAVLGLGGSLLSAKKGADASEKGSDAQYKAAMAALALQKQGLDFTKQQYTQGRTDMAPWLTAGKNALIHYQDEIYGKKVGGGSYFQKTPGYAFQVSEGEKGVVNNLAALGMKNSGSALKALTRFRTGLADQTYNTYLDRLGNLSGVGQTTAQNTATLGQQAAGAVNQGLNSMGNTLGQGADARASGYVGSANAWQQAIGDTTSNLSNVLGRYSYSRPTTGFPPAPGSTGPFG